jgi:hypothetical protein
MAAKSRPYSRKVSVRTIAQTITYREHVMIISCTANGGGAVTGTAVMRWQGPRSQGPIYTIVLDRPLPDGRCLIDAAEHHLLILATKPEKGSR